VGCGRIAPKSQLLRLALAPQPRATRALAVLDLEARMPGRGAYLCRGAQDDLPAVSCLDAATRRGGVARALRTSVTLDPKLVESPGERRSQA
jgi:predicted RNA-binding protein YlxR (DUF448 family)